MNMEVAGQDNRVAARDYIELNLKDEDAMKPLNQVQRDHLNSIVRSISTQYEIETWEIWKYTVHRVLGIGSIDEINQAKYPVAVAELEQYREILKSRRDQNAILDRVHRVVKEKALQTELDRHLLIEYGKLEINDLDPQQLLETLRYVESFNTAALPEEIKNHPAHLKRLNIELAIGVALGVLLTVLYYENWIV